MIPKLPTSFSYSGIKDFEGCQRRFYFVKVEKKYTSAATAATTYGTQAHEAFEVYVRDGTPLDPRFAQFEPLIAPLAAMEGEKFCELEMGLAKDFTPRKFDAADVWLRGIADYVCLNRQKKTAYVVDYKTGKSARFADVGQLELMAAMVMKHAPGIDKVKAGLLFVIANEFIKATFTRGQLPDILSKWAGKIGAIESAWDAGVWNACPSGLCRFCPVASADCEHRKE